MASIRKRFGKWLVEIRKKGSPYISKAFHDIIAILSSIILHYH